MSSEITVSSTGISVPQASEIKTAFQEVFTNAFGTDLSLDDATPQGVIIDDLTTQKMEENAQILYLFNQFNPSTSSGVFQDALANLYGLERKVATSSVVTCECIGIAGTVINGVESGNPAKAISTNGDIFQCLVGGTIPASGTISLQFGSVETGPIPVAANTVNKIFTSVNGWDSINNASSGTLGEVEESQADFEERRKRSLALNATGSLRAVYSRVFNLDGVTDLFVWENPTGSSVTYRGVTLTPHSIYMCINGVSDTTALAEAIYNSKSAGCDTVGSNTCTYTEPTTDVNYNYKYDIPTDSDVYFKVVVSSPVSQSSEDAIKQAIIDDFNGDLENGNAKITIGSEIYGSRFLATLFGLGLGDVVLEQVLVSKTSGSGWTNVIDFDVNILPTVSSSNITIEVNE